MIEAFKAGETAAKDFNSANVTADGGIKEGDYVFVLEKNTYVTVNAQDLVLTANIPLSFSDNVADDVDGTGGYFKIEHMQWYKNLKRLQIL